MILRLKRYTDDKPEAPAQPHLLLAIVYDNGQVLF